MSEQRNFKGVWIPADIWLARDLSLAEKVMMVEIDSLQHEVRGCYASNGHFADFFDLSKSRVSEIISGLVKKGLLVITQIRDGRQVVERQLRVVYRDPPPPSEKAANPLRKRRRTPSENGENPVGKDVDPPSENGEGSNPSLSNTGNSPVEGVTAEAGASAGGGVVVVEQPKPPVVITVGEKRFEIPAELRYPGPTTKSYKAWMNYAVCYHGKYGAWPVWNQTVAALITKFIARVGAEVAPKVAAFYVLKVNDTFVTKGGHSVKLLLADAEKYHTQYQTGRTVTTAQAQQIDKTQTNANAMDQALEISRARRANRGAANAH